ncbi:MAG: type II secretion system F family protein [Planctomycetaceae bacterium]|nr:type II secretion system F family protein [Planctomycetaceae bacterium]
MGWSPRASVKSLAGLCRRMSIALGAGIDIRKVIARETERARGSLRSELNHISQWIQQGESLEDALAQTGEYFPLLVREMIVVGEQSGNLETVLGQLADHYENRLVLRRNFLSAILWPMVQLAMALTIIGFLIWFMGQIEGGIDILGFGLIGRRGLTVYLTFLACVGAAGLVLFCAMQRGVFWVGPMQRWVLRLPVVGPALETLALSRLAWSMHLTMNTGMEIRRALQMSLRGTRNARYIRQIPVIEAEITAGHSLYEAFCEAGDYPAEFLDTLAVGEQSGEVVESMGRLARQYQERARLALALLTRVAGGLVWAAVALLLIALIFRLFSFYLGTIRSLL